MRIDLVASALLLAAAIYVPATATAGQGVGKGCSAFKPCNPGLSCHPFVQRCYNVPRKEGQPCMAGHSCGAGLTCEAGTQVCRGPAKRGETCHATKPCARGLSCQPGVHRCFDVPRKEGQPCAAGFECGAGLYCEAGAHVCRGGGGVGAPCHATRPCASGLSCQPGVQRCYHSPREVCEPCVAGFPCKSGLSCMAGAHVCRGPSAYEIEVKWAASPSGVKQPSKAVKDRLNAAVDRWRGIIAGHLSPARYTVPAKADKHLAPWIKPYAKSGTSWTDLRIVVRIAGKNQHEKFKAGSNVLAHAASVLRDAKGMPRLGYVEIGEHQMDSNVIGYTEAVLTHEIGHIIGFQPDVWRSKKLVSADNKYFVGKKAVAAWHAEGHDGNIPLQHEPCDDPPKIPGGHWHEDTLDNELMTPTTDTFIGLWSTMELTRVTTGALQDMGYGVVECEGGEGVRGQASAKAAPSNKLTRTSGGISLARNMAANTRGGYVTPGWSKTDDVVLLRGLVKRKSGRWGTIGTLPDGARPPYNMLFDVNAHRGRVRLKVSPAGVISVSPKTGNIDANWISLGGVRYSTRRGTSLPLTSNGSVNSAHCSNYWVPSYSKRSSLLVFSGLVTDKRKRFGHIATLTEELRPDRTHIFHANAHNNDVRVDVGKDGRIFVHSATGPTTQPWASLAGVAFATSYQPLPVSKGRRCLKKFECGYHQVGDQVFVTGALADDKKRWGHVATLPPGARPPATIVFPGNDHEGSFRIDVKSNGHIIITKGTGDARHRWVSLSNISFSTR